MAVKLPKISGVPAQALHLFWDDAAKLLAPAVAMAEGRMTLGLMHAQLVARDIQLWVAFDDESKMRGAWTSRIAVYAGAKVCELHYCGGHNIQSWLDDGLDVTEAWASSKGCGSVTIVGRQGWGRIAKHRGYGHFATIIEKKLTNGQIERRQPTTTAGRDAADAEVRSVGAAAAVS